MKLLAFLYKADPFLIAANPLILRALRAHESGMSNVGEVRKLSMGNGVFREDKSVQDEAEGRIMAKLTGHTPRFH